MKKMLGVLTAILGVVFWVPTQVLAIEPDEIMVYTSLLATEAVDVEYTYEITASTRNKPGASNEPTSLLVSLASVPPSYGVIAVQTPLSFAGADYVNTGIYHYFVREVASSNPTYPPSNKEYEIFVQVTRDQSTGAIVKQVYAQALDIATDLKGDMEFPHEQPMTYAYVENYTEGSLAGTGEYFRFRLEVGGPVGTKYTIAGQDTTAQYDGVTVVPLTEYEVKDGEDDNWIYVYLKDKQTLTVGLASDGSYQIPVGTKYRLVKDKVNKWYTTINGQDFNTEWEKMDWLLTVLDPVENKIVVINVRDFDVPMTGVILNILPFVVLVVLATVGITMMKRIKDEEKRNAKRKGRR